MKLFLKVHELPPGHTLPVVFLHVVTEVPETVQEVSLDSLDTTLVELLESTFSEAKSECTQTTDYDGEDSLDDA